MILATAIFDFHYALHIAPTILYAARITLLATVLAFLFAMIGGLMLALLRRSRWFFVRWTAMVCIELLRNTPLLIQLYIVFYVFPFYGLTLSPMVCGILGLGIQYSAYLSEVYRAGIENLQRGQWEACTALGFSSRRTWRRIVLPQILPPMAPVFGNYVIQMFKDTPLLATITVMELLGTALNDASHSFRYVEPITIVGATFLVLSYSSSIVVRKLERKFAVVH